MGCLELSGARAVAQAGVFTPPHKLLARREIKTASGAYSMVVPKRTARLLQFDMGSTLRTAHLLTFPPFKVEADSTRDRRITTGSFVHPCLVNFRVRSLRKI